MLKGPREPADHDERNGGENLERTQEYKRPDAEVAVTSIPGNPQEPVKWGRRHLMIWGARGCRLREQSRHERKPDETLKPSQIRCLDIYGHERFSQQDARHPSRGQRVW